jgi:cell surface protein SprA
MNLRASVEPWQDIRIDLTATRNESQNVNAFWRYDEDFENFTEQNRNLTGNYSISFFTMPTAWDQSIAPDYSSAVFQEFLDNRIEISRRLAQDRATRDPDYVAQIVGSPDSSYYGYDGYSVISQDVMIPAFLAAYTGNDPTNYGLNWKKSTPIPNWNLNYDGLMKIGWFRDRFQSFTLSHSYRSTYTVASFTTNLAYTDSLVTNPGSAPRNNNGDFMNPVLINQISLSEQFAPLIGFNVRMKNSISLRFDYKKDRNVGLSLANNQVSEIKGTEYTIGVGYILKDIRFNFIRVGAAKKAVQSNLELKADVSIRDNITVVRRIVENLDQVNAGQRIINIKFSADYAISQRITAKLFYDHNISEYKISTAFPTSNINAGISVRLSLGQ